MKRILTLKPLGSGSGSTSTLSVAQANAARLAKVWQVVEHIYGDDGSLQSEAIIIQVKSQGDLDNDLKVLGLHPDQITALHRDGKVDATDLPPLPPIRAGPNPAADAVESAGGAVQTAAIWAAVIVAVATCLGPVFGEVAHILLPRLLKGVDTRPAPSQRGSDRDSGADSGPVAVLRPNLNESASDAGKLVPKQGAAVHSEPEPAD